MPDPSFFRMFGVFTQPLFLPAAECEAIREDIRAAARLQAGVRKQDNSFGINQSIRSTKWAKVTKETSARFKQKLHDIRPEISRHFTLELSTMEEPQFLVYNQGDYYRKHRDSSADKQAAEYLHDRKVSIIVFLNGEQAEPVEGSYCGGSLTFYGLMNDPRMENRGMPLIGEEGLLVAFLPDLYHEVTPVTWGERYTAVSWFY